MAEYFLESFEINPNIKDENAERYRLYALIDDLYYWKMEWDWNNLGQVATVQTINTGFVSEQIAENYKNLRALNPTELREQFNSFAYFIERAVNGFKSYIMWISPDPQIKKIPWQIPTS